MRIDQLTFTRFIAAILIVFYHYGHETFLFNSLIGDIFKQANVGVSYFFVLSGFVMIIAYHKNEKIKFSEFLINRIARVYPLYLLSLLFVFIYFAIFYRNVTIIDLILHLFSIQAWVPSRTLTLNAPGWSISVEFLFYFSFPFLYNFIFNKVKLKSVFIITLLIWIISQIPMVFHFVKYNDNEWINSLLLYFPLLHLNEFIAGCAAGVWFIKREQILIKYPDLSLIIIGILLFLILKYHLPITYHNGFLAFLFIPLILILSNSKGHIAKLFKRKCFIFLGEISFGIYILQYPVYLGTNLIIRLLNHYSKIEFQYNFYIYLALLIFASALSFLLIEKPARNYIKQKVLS